MEKDSIKEFLDTLSDKKKEIKHDLPIKQTKKGWVKKMVYTLVFVSIIVFMVFFVQKFYQNYKQVRSMGDLELVSKVSRLVELPNENPVVTTITNLNITNNSLFFKEAMIGDKLLLFKVNKKAILYRPSTNKIVSTTPLN